MTYKRISYTMYIPQTLCGFQRSCRAFLMLLCISLCKDTYLVLYILMELKEQQLVGILPEKEYWNEDHRCQICFLGSPGPSSEMINITKNLNRAKAADIKMFLSSKSDKLLWVPQASTGQLLYKALCVK